MRKICIIAFLFLFSSCAITNPPSGPGVFYSNVKELVYYDSGVPVNSRAAVCSNNYFGFISVGDAGLSAIRSKSGIKKIASIEKTYQNTFLLFAKSCLIVTGSNY